MCFFFLKKMKVFFYSAIFLNRRQSPVWRPCLLDCIFHVVFKTTLFHSARPRYPVIFLFKVGLGCVKCKLRISGPFPPTPQWARIGIIRQNYFYSSDFDM